MTQKNIDYSKVTALLAGGALIAAIAAPAYFASNADNGLTELEVQEAMQKAIALQSFDINMTDSPKTIAIYEEIFQEDSYEAYAEILALDELDSRDFKRIIKEILNDNGQNVESYRDIEDFQIRDINLNINGDDVSIEIEFKVKYFNDGDGDDDELEAARFIVELNAEDAANRNDNDRSGAEIEDYDSSDFTLVRIY